MGWSAWEGRVCRPVRIGELGDTAGSVRDFDIAEIDADGRPVRVIEIDSDSPRRFTSVRWMGRIPMRLLSR